MAEAKFQDKAGSLKSRRGQRRARQVMTFLYPHTPAHSSASLSDTESKDGIMNSQTNSAPGTQTTTVKLPVQPCQLSWIHGIQKACSPQLAPPESNSRGDACFSTGAARMPQPPEPGFGMAGVTHAGVLPTLRSERHSGMACRN